MSLALDIADKMAARLTALTSTLAGVTCLVDRQKDIAVEVAKAVAKTSACAVTILYEGYANPDASRSGRPVVSRRYTASVWARPVLAGTTGKHADDVLETVSQSLHNWDPVEATDLFSEIHITRAALRPDARFLIYDIDIEITSIL